MHPAVKDAYARIFKWAACNPHAVTLPGHVQRDYDLIERHEQASTASMDQARDRFEIEQLREDVEDKATDYAWRRELEHRLADYVHDVADLSGRDELHRIGNKLSSCRMSGTYGQRPDGGMIIAWDTKCGLVRLCPDESREESRRIDRFYNPAIVEFVTAHPTHRAFYSVLTAHNYRQGDLARGKRELFDRFKALLKAFPNIQGALVVEEDPLSARMDWNVHLNVIFLVKGRFDYAAVREAWGSDLYIQELKKDEQSISASIRELIKYSAMIITEKGEIKEDQADDDEQGPPGMIDWPADLWLEWWDAQQRFRRTRAYGCLYALHGRTWDAMTQARRKAVIRDAKLPEREARRCELRYSKRPWKEVGRDLTKKDRERLRVKLRRAMVHGEGVDLLSVRWLGSLSFDGGCYRVDLVPGDNFSGGFGQNGAGSAQPTGPPPDF